MKRRIVVCLASMLFSVIGLCGEPVLGAPYPLPVYPREDSRQKDSETGADLLFLTQAKAKDTHLYFHQRSWLADGSVILFLSGREKGGLMGYVVETGELIRILAADGSRLRNPTAAARKNAVMCMAGDRVLEIQLTVSVSQEGVGANAGGTVRHAVVMARERHICTVRGVDGSFNESCDGRYLAGGRAYPEDAPKPGLVLIDTETGRVEQLCSMPEGVGYHGHVQWSVTNPNWVSFAGDPYRLWVVDIRDKKPWAPYKESKDELVTHESWWVQDQLLFCGGGHKAPAEESHVKALDMHQGTIRIVGAGSWWPDAPPKDLTRRNWWHASGSPDGRWVAGDNWHGDIMLFEGKTTRPRLLTTNHRTYGGGEHPEVGWDRKGRQVIFSSHKLGGVTVCIATIPESWQEESDRLAVGLEAK